MSLEVNYIIDSEAPLPQNLNLYSVPDVGEEVQITGRNHTYIVQKRFWSFSPEEFKVDIHLIEKEHHVQNLENLGEHTSRKPRKVEG